MSEEDTGNDGGSTFTTETEQSNKDFENSKDNVVLLAKSLSNSEHIEVEHIRGGSYNRVILVRCTRKGENFLDNLLSRVNDTKLAAVFAKRLPLLARLMKRSEAQTLNGVFRIPRDPNVSEDAIGDEDGARGSQVDSEILDQAAVLQFLGVHNIAAPKLLAFDATAANAISTPYVLQEYCDASPLDSIYDNMSLPEKLSIADAVVDALLSMERIGFSEVGSILAEKSSEQPAKGSYLIGAQGPSLRLEVCGCDIKINRGSHDFKAYESTFDLISTQLKARYQKEFDQDEESVVADMYERLLEICDDMKALGFFPSQSEGGASTTKGILYHWDLMPRNILVKRVKPSVDDQRKPNGSEPAAARWVIDKIIDWDRVLAVPPILARMPPLWLWDFSDDAFRSSRPSIASDYDGDADLHLPTRYDAEGGKLSPGDQQIRQHFEERFVAGLAAIYGDYDEERYHDEAYGKGRYIRRLARFALHGACYSQDWKRFDHLDEEWPTARLQFTKE